MSSRNVVLAGGAGWGFHPPAWETQESTPETDIEAVGDDAEAGPVAVPFVEPATAEKAATATSGRAAPGQKVAYVRVSSKDQNLARQREALEPVGIDRWYSDQISARSRAKRPGLDDCISYVRDGDELHVASIDRLARSLIDLKQLVAQLTDKGVSVHFHKENLTFPANRTDSTADLMLGFLGSFAEFERSIIQERQAEGIALAKKAGKYTGRPKALTEEKVAEARRRVAAGEKKTTVAEKLGVNRSTLYRHL